MTVEYRYPPREAGVVKWDLRFLRLAREISTWSKDPSTKVGAVLVAPDREIISVGYNGFARGVCDDPSRYADRDNKIASIIHGEENALAFAERWQLPGSTCYTYPWQPCARCASKLIQGSIKRVVSIVPDEAVVQRWGASLEIAIQDFAVAGVELVCYKPGDLDEQNVQRPD